MNAHPTAPADDSLAWLHELLHHLEHVLPGQAPIKDFVHHNTLHGFQHLDFRDALAAAEAATGAHGFLPADTFRTYFQQGRIDLADLNAALDDTPELQASAALPGNIARREVLLTGLQFDLKPVDPAAVHWRIDEMDALSRCQDGVSSDAQARLQADGGQLDLPGLWSACHDVLNISPDNTCIEGISLQPAPSATLQDEATALWSERQLKRAAEHTLAELIDQPGQTLRGLLLRLTGRDLLDTLRPYLVRHLSAYLDQGMAAWHHPERERGLYAAWLDSARTDLHFELADLSGWETTLERLPADPGACIQQQLLVSGLPQTHWAAYLETLAKELPGWSGMVLWRQLHPKYEGQATPISMVDYLALRLVLEQVYAQRLANTHFKSEATLHGLRGYLRRHPAELQVRLALYNNNLPEWLEDQCHRLVREAVDRPTEENDTDWLAVLRLLDTLHAQDGQPHLSARVWPLFLLCQHLGVNAAALRTAGNAAAAAWLDCLDELNPQTAGWIWLQAYERHYREQVFGALTANEGRGPWKTRDQRPAAQVMFCMDDREEGMRRHLEEIAPAIETLGAAAHFNVPHAFRALDEAEAVALAPVVPTVVIPAQEVREQACAVDATRVAHHAERRAARLNWQARVMQGTRIGLLRPSLLSAAAAPLTLGVLAGKAFAPAGLGRWIARARDRFELKLQTRINFVAPNDSPPATPDARQLGFTDIEQADRVQMLLRNSGLTYGFAPLAVIMGHGSHSQNNPHGSAYNCGACAGRFSGPNARLVAAMANRAEVRALLRERGISIPDDTWFLGSEHDTCDDVVIWYDTDLVPPPLQAALATLQTHVLAACKIHAQERCRRFMSASTRLSPDAAWNHVSGRANDYSQARPELGHATNASAFIGRRAATRGAFFDRRIFLISYDPSQDTDGSIIERHLLTNGVVGAGISLEYYFSTVNNERYGCGTKVMHNVAGMVGVMEGAASDLRTGLPRQMIEIHEAMRLLAIVEQKTDVLTAVYMRQPPLQELVGKGWVQLAAKDPDTAEIHRFVPGTGWVKWQPSASAVQLPTVQRSAEWYHDQREPLSPALITRGMECA